MAYSVLQSASATAAGGINTVAATYSGTVASDSKLIALVSYASTNFCTAVKDAALNSWTQIAATAHAGFVHLTLWALDVPAADAGTSPTLTATLAGTSSGSSILIQEVSGLLAGNTVAMIDGAPGYQDGGLGNSSTGSAAYSSTATGEYLVCCYGDDGGTVTYTKPAGYTADTHGVNASGLSDCVISWKDSTGGSEVGSYALSGSADFALITIALRLAPPGFMTHGVVTYPYS
jgi:hypothetical protein